MRWFDALRLRMLRLLDQVRQDVRYAFTSFRRTPGFTAIAILTFAFGIGATASIFSAVNAVLMRPLPFKSPERLVNIREADLRRDGSTFVSSGNFVEWKDRALSFQQAAAWRFEYFNVAGRDEPEQVQGLRVSPSFLRLLGASAQIGRTFVAGDDQPGRQHVVLVSHALWKRRFAASNVVGTEIQIGGEPYTVVGVLPPAFHFFAVLNRPIDLYIPLTFEVRPLDRKSHDLNVYARLQAGVSQERAQSEMNALYRDLAQAYPQTNATLGVRLISVPDAFTRGSRPVLLLLMAAVGTLLLIACANVANLLLARATLRQKEMALRAALGADRGRLIRQLLTESVFLALVGGFGGTLLAIWGVHVLNRVVPLNVVGRIEDFTLDGQVFAFSLVLSVICGIVFGCAPVWQSAERALSETLESAGRGAAIDGRRSRRTGHLFVVAQLALALVLSSGAMLLARSARILQGMPRGLNLHNVLTMQIRLPRTRYPDSLRTSGFFHDVLQRVERLPGVESASVVNFPPLAPQDAGVALRIEGRATASADEQIHARYSVIDPQFFRTMQIPLLSGRSFIENDADEARGVAIVAASMAHRFWPDENPIGRRIQPQFTGPQNFWDADFKNLPLTIVGVVGDIRDDGPALEGRDDVPLFYVPYRQNSALLMHLVIRTRSNPLDAAPAVRGAVWAIDKTQPVFDVKSMEDVVAETFGQPRVMARLTGTFALAALLLAALGVYGLLSYVVNQRRREIGIRMALGARPQDVLQAIVREAAYLGLVGLAVGLLASFGLSRLIAGFLFGVGAADPRTFADVAALLFGVTLLACLVPACRAMRVDPVVALRCE
jgi:putative ABC transport system permease protein